MIQTSVTTDRSLLCQFSQKFLNIKKKKNVTRRRWQPRCLHSKPTYKNRNLELQDQVIKDLCDFKGDSSWKSPPDKFGENKYCDKLDLIFQFVTLPHITTSLNGHVTF